jgi:hypothetical protein
MKNEFAFLYPPPRDIRFAGASVDIRSLSFPLETFKQFEPLFAHFAVRNRSRGLAVVFAERPAGSPAKGTALGGEEYAIECDGARVVLAAASPRGRFYALATLLQVLAFHEACGRMPVFTLRDSPALPVRGFAFAGAPPPAGLESRLLRLALLRVNPIAFAGAPPPAAAALARMSGVEIGCLGDDAGAIHTFGSGAAAVDPVPAPAAGSVPTAEWFAALLLQLGRVGERGARPAVWSDHFLRCPEWIRKIPRDVLVLHRDHGPEQPRFFAETLPLFRRHHLAQALCPVLGGNGRLFTDVRSTLARVEAAAAAALGSPPAGVILLGGGEAEAGLPQGAAMLYFQAGVRLWRGGLAAPDAFSRWALGRDEPGLFRVYSFLAQAEHQLPLGHDRYLFEDPVAAPCSRQGDPRAVLAHFRKAALYLSKREVAASELSGFIDFARRLYGFIAAKVEFSLRLEALLAAGDAGIALLAGRLGDAVMELHAAWRGLGGAAAPAAGFDRLAGRLARIGREASTAAGRVRLKAEVAAARAQNAGDPGEGAGS